LSINVRTCQQPHSVARDHPQVPTIIAHMGAVWNVPEAIIVAERQPHVYLETSATLMSDVKRAYARLGPEKILMGSEWPGSDFDLERILDRWEQLYRELSWT